MVFVPASRLAEHPKQWWTSKIRGKCAGKRPGKASELALAKPNTRTFSTANVFQYKRWKLVHVGTFQCGKAEQWKFLLHPPLHGVPAKKICYSTREAILLMFFPWADLHNRPGICKNRFFDFDCRNLGNRLARTLHNPSNRLKDESGAGTLLAETRHNPGGTELAKAWNPAEPSGTRRSGRTQRNPAEPGGTRRNPAEPGGTRRNLAEPGGNLAETKK